jgi:hypothetical protein
MSWIITAHQKLQLRYHYVIIIKYEAIGPCIKYYVCVCFCVNYPSRKMNLNHLALGRKQLSIKYCDSESVFFFWRRIMLRNPWPVWLCRIFRFCVESDMVFGSSISDTKYVF